MGQERVIRLPVNENKILDVEIWLEQMALKGYFLKDTAGKWWYFDRGEPKRVRYRMEMMTARTIELDAERREEYEAAGWHYVTPYKTAYHIFMADDPEAVELHTDPQVFGLSLKQYEAELKMAAIAAVLIFFYGLYMCQRFYLADWVSWPAITLAGENGLFSIVCLAMLIAGIVRAAANYRSFRALRRQMEEGESAVPTEEQVRRKRYCLWIPYLYLAGMLLFVVLLFQSCGSGGPVEQQLRYGDVFPALEFIEDGTVLQGEEYNGGDIIWYENPLLKERYQVNQTAIVEGRDGEKEEAKLRAEFYNTRLEAFAVSLEKEMKRREENGLSGGEGSFQREEIAGFDAWYSADSEGVQTLLARRGSKVLLLSYRGRTRLEEKADILRQIMDGEFTNPPACAIIKTEQTEADVS